MLGAAISGAIFGDHASPISDTTVLASMASASDHIEHVRTQLPYALLAAAIASAGFIGIGLIQ
jgi:Na+/H+ antiporter NhaC